MEFFTALTLVLGLGTCDSSNDWCERPVGEYGLEMVVAEYDRHSVTTAFRHFSGVNYKDPNGGINLYMVEYRYDLWRKK